MASHAQGKAMVMEVCIQVVVRVIVRGRLLLGSLHPIFNQ
jgi:hypothetical protein